jgi:RNA polymerase sigma-70 factor (ECF subfamily)
MAVMSDSLIQRFVRDRGHYLGFLRVLCRDDELAEELFQELSVAVIEKVGTFDSTRDFGAWVRGIARNLYLKACRDRRVKAGKEQSQDPALVDAVVQAYDGRTRREEEELREKMAHLRACVEKLPIHLRGLVRDRYESNCSSQKLAELHDRSVSAVETALSRVRATLLECLQRQARSTP